MIINFYKVLSLNKTQIEEKLIYILKEISFNKYRLTILNENLVEEETKSNAAKSKPM